MSKFKPRCRLYLQVAAPITARLEMQLSQALADLSPACVLLSGGDEPLRASALDGLIDRVQGAGAACLIRNDIEASADLGADGVHIAADPSFYKYARETLGESANIGVGCGLSRHEAMALAESGADYVAFGGANDGEDAGDAEELSETIGWWSEIFVVPCVAWDIGDIAEAERLTKLGVDFIAPPATIWDNDDALGFLREMDRVIGTIRRDA